MLCTYSMKHACVHTGILSSNNAHHFFQLKKKKIYNLYKDPTGEHIFTKATSTSQMESQAVRGKVVTLERKIQDLQSQLAGFQAKVSCLQKPRVHFWSAGGRLLLINKIYGKYRFSCYTFADLTQSESAYLGKGEHRLSLLTGH